MSRKKIVVGNWKMNMTMDQSISLIKELKSILLEKTKNKKN